MITKWKLSNFKSVRGPVELPFAALTIFSGPNSSGKSTCIQSILMISQTLAHRVGTRSVVLNGVLARLGQFDDLLSFDSSQKEIEVGWECAPFSDAQIDPLGNVTRQRAGGSLTHPAFLYVDEVKSVSCDLSFDAQPPMSGPPTELAQLHPGLAYCKIGCETETVGKENLISTAEIARSSKYKAKETELNKFLSSSEAEQDILRRSFEFDVALDQNSLDEVRESLASANLVGCVLRHFLPERLTLSIEAIEERSRVMAMFLQTGSQRAIRGSQFSEQEIAIPPDVIGILKKYCLDKFPDSLLPESGLPYREVPVREWTEALRGLNPLLRYRLQQALQSIPSLPDLIYRAISHGLDKQIAVRSFNLPNEIRDATAFIDYVFTTSISYLGPLRDDPKPVYPLPTSPDLAYVGLKGEYTAAVLDLHRSRYVQYVPPEYFTSAEQPAGLASARLQEAVANWLRYLGVADSVQTQDRGKLGHEMNVKTPGASRAHDLTHAGVGLSQVLPILVHCLLSRTDATLLIEQPELHLHPSVQSRLGDFFLSLALVGKQCIIETHSEYLINRLRYRMASSPPERPLTSLTKIYFVEKKGPSSTFREVGVNDYGAILEWPEGFFDESQNEAEQIVRAASKKRLRVADTQNNAKRDV